MLKKESFKVEGLDCQEEVILLKKVLSHREGVLSLNFNLLKAKITIEYEEKKITPDEIIASIRATGLKAARWTHRRSLDKLTYWGRKGRFILTIFSGIFLILGFISEKILAHRILHLFTNQELADDTFLPFVSLSFYFLSIVCGLWHVAPKAFFAIKKIRADMNLLMMIASVGAMIIGQWFEGASVVFLYSISLLLEQASVKKARDAVASLLNLAPDVATVITDKGLIEKRVHELKIGDRILIKPSDKIPIDAVIIKGKTSINQSSITGESLPVEKEENDEVFAGTINEESSIECEVTKLSFDTMLAKMIYLIEHATAKRAKAEQTIEKFAGIYTPIMIGLAIIVGTVPPVFFDAKWIEWIYRGLVLLVIACPCALVISTPVCLISGLTSAARQGVLIKGGIFLELAKDLKAIAFDKTGTLTYGKPALQKIVPFNGLDENSLLAIAASLEKASSHPLARAILERAEEGDLQVKHAQNVRILPGKGIEGYVEGKYYWLGSHRFLHEKKLETPEIHKKAESLEDAGHSIIAVGDNEMVCGLLSVADSPRKEVAHIMDEIRASGIQRTIILTGDNSKCAKEIARVTKVDEFFSELLPKDKVDAIESLKEKYEVVAMVGDGVNDAPAMAAADIGIAMGVIGTDAALESADIALMQDDLSKLPWLIKHSKRTMRILQENIVFSLAVKVVFLFLAVFGFAGLWMAIAADTGASLLVVFNAMRLLKKTKE